MVRMDLVSVGVVHDGGSIVMVLRAAEMARLLVMEIGPLEGRAIAMESEGIRPPRPLTHDLLANAIAALGARLSQVVIKELKDSTYFADLILERDGHNIEVDARPSDAVALALRVGAPIYAAEALVAQAGIDESGDDPVVH